MVFKHHTNNFSAKSVHKKAIVRTQKCTHVYTKMYSGVHKNVQGRTLKCIKACIFSHGAMCLFNVL